MDDDMLRLIANPHRLKPECKKIQTKPSLNTKIRYLLCDMYPEMYISETLVDDVCKDIGDRIQDETIHSVVNEMIEEVFETTMCDMVQLDTII
jgi:hypothetical protein